MHTHQRADNLVIFMKAAVGCSCRSTYVSCTYTYQAAQEARRGYAGLRHTALGSLHRSVPGSALVLVIKTCQGEGTLCLQSAGDQETTWCVCGWLFIARQVRNVRAMTVHASRPCTARPSPTLLLSSYDSSILRHVTLVGRPPLPMALTPSQCWVEQLCLQLILLQHVFCFAPLGIQSRWARQHNSHYGPNSVRPWPAAGV